MPDYLFAYGTLLPGAAPAEIAGVAARLKAVGEGSVRGRLYDLGHFPGAVLEAAGNEGGDAEGSGQYNDERDNGERDNAEQDNAEQDNAEQDNAEQDNAARVIYGTIFELPGDPDFELSGDPEILASLDAYEEFDPENAGASQFLRTRCVVSLATGAAMACWIYVYNCEVTSARVVEGGRWNARAIND